MMNAIEKTKNDMDELIKGYKEGESIQATQIKMELLAGTLQTLAGMIHGEKKLYL